MDIRYKRILLAFLFLVVLYVIISFTILINNLGGNKPPIESNIQTTSTEEQNDNFIPQPTDNNEIKSLISENTGSISLSGVMNNNFKYLDSENKKFSSGTFSELLGLSENTIVYFYPKDGTPNCTIQALDFSIMLNKFREKGYNVIGVSKDSIDSHLHFAELNELKIQLLEDGSGALLRAFGAEGKLQEYGNGTELSDIIRSTFIVDKNGNVKYAFKDVIAKGHARRIYELVTGEKY